MKQKRLWKILFIAMSASMLVACSSPTTQKTGLIQETWRVPCRDGEDVKGVDGEAALTALTDWGAALKECREKNSALIQALDR